MVVLMAVVVMILMIVVMAIMMMQQIVHIQRVVLMRMMEGMLLDQCKRLVEYATFHFMLTFVDIFQHFEQGQRSCLTWCMQMKLEWHTVIVLDMSAFWATARMLEIITI